MQLKHSPEKLMDVTLMPIIFLLLFLYVFGGVVAGSTHAYLEVLLPGLVGQMAMFATMGLGTALCDDIHKGVFDRFRSLPIARSAPLIGAVLGDTIRFCVVMAVLTGFGSALGFRFHTGLLVDPRRLRPGLRVLPGGVLDLGADRADRAVAGDRAGHLVHLDHAAGVRQQRAAANTRTMPGWLQAWVNVNPVTHLANAVRALTIGGPWARHVLVTLAWAAGIVVVVVPAGHADVPAPRVAPSRSMIARDHHRPPWRPTRKLPATRRTVLGRGTWSLVWTGGRDP